MHINYKALWRELNIERIDEDLTWAEVAEDLDTSTATLRRMQKGYAPRAETFVRALVWLDALDLTDWMTE
jgi:hypothetical protein